MTMKSLDMAPPAPSYGSGASTTPLVGHTPGEAIVEPGLTA